MSLPEGLGSGSRPPAGTLRALASQAESFGWGPTMGRLFVFPLSFLLALGMLLAPIPGGAPATDAGCMPHAFRLEVYPPRDPNAFEWSPGAAFLGQRINYLVRVLPSARCPGAGNRGYVTISAKATFADVQIPVTRLRVGDVGEVFVMPHRFTNDAGFRMIRVTVKGERHGYVWTISQRQAVWMDRMNQDARAMARDRLDRYLEFLAAEYPELGISPETRFMLTPVRPRMLIVSWWLFFSEEWEIGLEIHMMPPPPDDYTRIYIRHRWDTWAPSRAWLISSVGWETPIEEIVPPSTAVRGAEWWNTCRIGQICPE